MTSLAQILFPSVTECEHAHHPSQTLTDGEQDRTARLQLYRCAAVPRVSFFGP